ncbi:MAG: S46 family peptidase [Ignavibacteriae bacterium]|nr:S46 family peptidase [Ignavibacteriota bacterium]
MKSSFINSLIKITIILILTTQIFVAQEKEALTVESDIFDTGKMWTFDYPPAKHLEKTYGFTPSEEWFEDVRLSALRIPSCTASFVSENGLIMTNNHCSTWHRDAVEKEGEDLSETGFYATTIEEERNVNGMFAEQLSFIVDVTDEINEAINSGETDEEKVKNKKDKVDELVEMYNEDTGLKCQFVSLFNGGKFSIYGYKRYEDVRLVFVPEQAIASFGGNLDNFTYPRYDLDVAFFRVYDDEGNPVNSENYFKFSDNGVQKDEVIFSVGNPGRTNRLKTVSQLEYNRDLTYRNRAFMFDGYYNLLEELKAENPDRADEFEKIRTRIGNGQKVFHYTQIGLLNPSLIARKRDFENKIVSHVKADANLNEQYGHIWDAIKTSRNELKPYGAKLSAYKLSKFWGSEYFFIAKDMLKFAEQMKLAEEDRLPKYKGEQLDSVKNAIYSDSLDTILNLAKLQLQLDYIRLNLGDENEFVQKLSGNLKGKEAAKNLIKNSVLASKKSADKLLNAGADKILECKDPFFYFIKNTQDEIKTLTKKSKEVKDSESILENQLGKVLFEIYGTEIPPDANFTLRLSDGVLKTFDYNGTQAVTKSTFYGMYNRYHGSDKTYPWNLPSRWKEVPAGFDLATPYNFISTNDIVGGSSGSAVINENAEIVGLAFDGNINSLIGNFIYLPEDNRMVSVASQAIIESLGKVYKAERIYSELTTGKMVK